MTMNQHHTLWIGLMGLILLNTGCDRLSQGVVQEIEFPEHEPRLAVTMLCNWDADTLVARAQSSAGILDSVGSQKQKEALFTLSHTGGASHTWGGTDDWENGIGHVLVNPGLEEGDWTLTVEAPGFDPATALQSTPPRIDTLLGSDYRMTYALSWQEPEIETYPGEDKVHVEQIVEIELSLPHRLDAQDFFLLRPVTSANGNEEEAEEYASIRVNREFDQDPRAERLEIIEGLLIQEVTGTAGLESIHIELNVEYYGPSIEAYQALNKSFEVVAITPEMAAFYTSIENNLNPSGFSLFSEPLLAYTNVSSGYGCFGIYRSIVLPLD